MLRLVLASLILIGFLLNTSSAQVPECNSVAFCLSEGETDCAVNSNICPGGTYCRQRDSDPTSEVTGNIIGTCVKAATAGEDCSVESGKEVQCYDPNLYTIFCDDRTNSEGNQTCKYIALYGPGEACKPNDDKYYNGGCVYGECNSTTSKCSSLALGDRCTEDLGGIDEMLCAPGLFCDFVSTGLCIAQRARFENCSNSAWCQSGLICSTGATSTPSKCRPMFAQPVGGNCDSSAECQVGLLCTTEQQCVAPSRFEGGGCATNDVSGIELFCQPGWDCECIADITEKEYVEQGGECTHSAANSQEFVDSFTAFQKCLGDRSTACQGINYMLTHAEGTGYGPDSCFAICAQQTNFDVGSWSWKFPETFGRKRVVKSDRRVTRLDIVERPGSNPLIGLPPGKCFLRSDVATIVPLLAAIAQCVVALIM